MPIAEKSRHLLKAKCFVTVHQHQIEARHLCMMMRGVEKQHSAAVTSAMFGVFRNEEETRSEFLSLILQRPNGV